MALSAALLAHCGSAVRPIAAQEAPAEAPTGPEVVELRFEGAHSLSVDRLETAIETRATRCRSPFLFLFCSLGADWALERAYLNPAVLPEDEERIETLYEIWGYPDAEVGSRVVPRGDDRVAVEFDIAEGEPIRVASLEIRGLDAVSPPVELAEPLPLRPGDAYALPRLEELRQRIVAAFAERGRPYAQVEIQGDVDEPTRTVRLVLTVAAGPPVVFGPAEVVAEPPIDEEVVRERLAFEPGEPYRPSALAETERALYALPVVERVTIEQLGPERGDTVVATRIVVAARRVQAIQVEGSISSTDCLELAVFWANRYFLGGPRLFSLGVGFSNLLANVLDGGFPCTSTGEDEFADPNYFVQADLRQPWPGHPRTALLLSGFFVRESSPQAYVQRGYGGEIGVAREFSPDFVGSALYSPQRNQLRAADFYFCANFGVCEPAALDELTDYTWYAPIELLSFWTPTGPPVEVRHAAVGERWRGWIRSGIEGAAGFTGSEYDYIRAIPEGAATRLSGSRYELAGRIRLGVLGGEEILPPQVRIYSGGPNTVRGVPQNLLGPKFLVTAPDNVLDLGCVLMAGGCPPGLVVDPDLVSVRPAGGEALIELNAEGRVWVANSVQLVMFVDFGALRRNFFGDDDALFTNREGEALLTPGVGVRILTGFGPLRLDLGFDPSGSRIYPIFTRDPLTDDIIVLGAVTYDPFTFDDPGWLTELFRRLQLQVAIGQPF